MELDLVIVVLLLLLILFLATVDSAFSFISDVGLRRISSDEDAGYSDRSIKFLREILDNRPRFRFALSSTIQVLIVIFVVLLTVDISHYVTGRPRVFAFAILIAIVLTITVRQVIPRLIVRNEPERKLLKLLPAIRPIFAIASFFVEPLAVRNRTKAQQKIDSTVTPEPADDKSEDNSEDFQALMEVGEAEGIIEESEREMIESFVEFSETRAGEIMTPRTEVVAVAVGTTVKEARDVMIGQKISRLPIYRDNIDSIEGILYVRDLLAALASGREADPVEDVMREAFFVPETKTASELLKSMQAAHVQIAIVIDEYGGVAGLVTVEDILEEIVGELEDEDSVEEEIIEVYDSGEGFWDVIGSTDIDKIERIFDTELEDEDYTTIAGLVTSEVGYIPKVGEKLTLRGLDIEILQADEKRIQLLRLRKAVDTVDPDDAADLQ
jgi:putative hemolysin